jgi:uncharacterized membrane protein
MELFNTDRARFAANTLLGVEIAFGTLSFWSKAFERAHWIDFVVAGLLTAAFGSVSLLASGVVIRAVAAKDAGEHVTRGLSAFCGLVIALISGFMTWHGLVWADAQADLIPGTEFDWLFIPAALVLSTLNLVSIYVFCRDIKPRQVVIENPARQLANKRWNKEAA